LHKSCSSLLKPAQVQLKLAQVLLVVTPALLRLDRALLRLALDEFVVPQAYTCSPLYFFMALILVPLTRYSSISISATLHEPSNEISDYMAREIEQYFKSTKQVYLGNGMEKKWGWVIYRTTYSDQKWGKFCEIFRKNIIQSVTKYYQQYNHLKYLDWPTWQDPILFNNISTSTLRTHFQA
jgi:hypothetical protein